MPNTRTEPDSHKTAIERALRTHPGVRAARVADDGCGGLRAHVVPDDSYMDEVMGRGAAGSALVGKWRKTFDLSQFDKKAATAPVGFNTMGWNSSYTRGPISLDEMHEWVENTADDILRLKPANLLEIGCGTGMIVLRVAPHCERYVAVDQSSAVLGRLRQQLQTLPDVAGHVEVFESQAAELDRFSENTFDTAVLNSVVQFFPNVAYLTKVLENAISLVKPGGHVYVGDVRSLPLLRLFTLSVELFQAADQLSSRELRERIHRRLEREPELLLSPAFFLALPREFPKISRVDIRPLRGRSDNEMTRFRYEAILHVGPSADPVFEGEFKERAGGNWTLDEFRSLLKGNPDRPIGVKSIRNARIEKDLAAMAILDAAESAYPAGELRRTIESRASVGIHPQALFDLENEDLGFAVFLSWAAYRDDGSFDAFFIPKQMLQGAILPAIRWPAPEASAFLHFSNAPGQTKMRAELQDQLLAFCNRDLPAEIALREIVLVDSIETASTG